MQVVQAGSVPASNGCAKVAPQSCHRVSNCKTLKITSASEFQHAANTSNAAITLMFLTFFFFFWNTLKKNQKTLKFIWLSENIVGVGFVFFSLLAIG